MENESSGTSSQLELALERTHLAVLRNRMANERTFLSWLRTGLAGVGGGVAILRLLTFDTTWHKNLSHGVGISLMLWGIAVIFFAWWRFRSHVYKVGEIREAPYPKWPVAVCVFVLIALCLVLTYITAGPDV